MRSIYDKTKTILLKGAFFFLLFVYYLLLLMMIEYAFWLIMVNIYPVSACNVGMGKATLWGLVVALAMAAQNIQIMGMTSLSSKQNMLSGVLSLLRTTGVFIVISSLITIWQVNLENSKTHVREYYKQQATSSNISSDVVGTFGFDKVDKPHAILITGASEGNVVQVMYALQHGANVNDVVGPGFSALYYAASNGKLNTVITLIEQGADMGYHNGPAQRTALHEASLRGHYDIVQYLLEKGADVNAKNKFNRTPLYYVTNPPPPLKLPDNSKEIAKLLKRFGGNI